MLYAIAALLLVAVDQITKYLTRLYIPLGEHIPVLPDLMGLTHIQNTGAAFSFLSDHTWILTLISLVMSIVLTAALVRRWIAHPFGRWCLTVTLAGAVGNLIDRVAFGYVTDMIETLFMDFAVYNFADICVVLGCIALAVYIIFFYDKMEGKCKSSPREENHAHPDGDS